MRTKKTVVILASGKAGAGKTTVSDYLLSKLKDTFSMDVLEYGFADPIKYIAEAYGGWDRKKDERGRTFLQGIGQVWRDYDQDIWVKHFLNQLDKKSGMFPKNFVVIDDWRFPNELAYLQNNPMLDIITVRVFGRQGELSDANWADVSENSLPESTTEYLGYYRGTRDKFGYDFSIDNSVTMEALDRKLDIILAEISKEYIVE